VELKVLTIFPVGWAKKTVVKTVKMALNSSFAACKITLGGYVQGLLE